jgi:hypothetical protein
VLKAKPEKHEMRFTGRLEADIEGSKVEACLGRLFVALYGVLYTNNSECVVGIQVMISTLSALCPRLMDSVLVVGFGIDCGA